MNNENFQKQLFLRSLNRKNWLNVPLKAAGYNPQLKPDNNFLQEKMKLKLEDRKYQVLSC